MTHFVRVDFPEFVEENKIGTNIQQRMWRGVLKPAILMSFIRRFLGGFPDGL
jgi:hypothetical protein